jgi:AcrR family transcriptional regulator
MDDVAEKAEISRGTLFNYFPSKDALLLPWGQEILDGKIRPTLDAYLETRPTTVQALQLLFTNMTEIILASPDVIQAFMHEAMKPNNEKVLAGTGGQEIFIQVLRYGQERSEVRSDIPLENLARYVGAVHASLLFCLLVALPPENSSQEIARLLAFIETGISPRS